MKDIHPTAIVDSAAILGGGVRIGPFSIIEAGVTIGDRTIVMSHARLCKNLTIGPDCVIHMGAIIGHEPQDHGMEGEGGGLVVGARNIIREYVTIHRSSIPGNLTQIGDENFLLGFSHIGHDCFLGNKITIANAALLSGYVTVGDRAFISGNVVIHQFVRIGELAMIGGQSRVIKDVPPFMLVEGNSKVRGMNVLGMRRAEMSAEQRQNVKEAFHLLYKANLNVPNAVTKLKSLPQSSESSKIIEFIRKSNRGLCSADFTSSTK